MFYYVSSCSLQIPKRSVRWTNSRYFHLVKISCPRLLHCLNIDLFYLQNSYPSGLWFPLDDMLPLHRNFHSYEPPVQIKGSKLLTSISGGLTPVKKSRISYLHIKDTTYVVQKHSRVLCLFLLQLLNLCSIHELPYKR